MASASNESRITKEKYSANKRMLSAPEEKQLLTICSGIEIAKLLDNCVTSASVSSAQHTASVRLRLYSIDTGFHVKL